MKAVAFVILEVDFYRTSCHSTLPSVILIMADKFELRWWWWGNAENAFSFVNGSKINRIVNAPDGVGWGGSVAGCWDWTWQAFLWHLTNQILMLHITQSHSSRFAFIVEPFQRENIWLSLIDLSPSAAAHLQDILKSNYKNQNKHLLQNKRTEYSLLTVLWH